MFRLSHSDRWALGTFLALWGGSTLYLFATGADAVFPMISLVLFGGMLSGLALLLTRPDIGPGDAVQASSRALVAVLGYLLFYAIVVLGWLFGAVRDVVPPGPVQEVVMLVTKLAVHVGAPMAIYLALGAVLPARRSSVAPRTFWRTLLVFAVILTGLLAVVSPSLRNLTATGAAWPMMGAAIVASFLWYSVEAGLCEEYLFRGILQNRLVAVLKGRLAAILATSVIFALAHAPGLYLRGGPGVDGWSTDAVQVAAFTIATLAPLSILFGTIYARTGSLLLVILLHGTVDTLPHASEMLKIWFPV